MDESNSSVKSPEQKENPDLMPMKFIDKDTVSFRQTAVYALPVTGLVLALTLLIAFVYLGYDSGFIFIASIVILLSALIAISMRGFYCSINKREGKISYQRDGIMGTRFYREEFNYDISRIVQLEMKRHINRYSDTFQILLALNNDRSFPLTGSNLGFSDCQKYAERLREFLELKAPVKAVD